MVKLATLQEHIGAVEKVPVGINQADRVCPFEGGICPVCIRVVAGVYSEPGRDVEEAAIGDGVLVIIAVVEGEDLPSQTSSAGGIVPSPGLRLKNGLRQTEPLRLAARGIWEVVLSGRHGSQAPETLVVVAFGPGLVWRHVVAVGAGLMQHRLHCHVIPLVIAGEIIVVNHGTEHGASFPPVIGIWQIPRYVPWLVASIVLHHARGGGLRGGLY